MIHNKVYLREGRDDVWVTSYVRNPENVITPRPAVLVISGGSYQICTASECEPVAIRFMNMGYQAFVLYYSVGQWGKNEHDTTWPQPLLDAGAAILHIRDHAEEYGVDPNQIAVSGFSAGGHLAAMVATDWNNPILSETYHRPAEDFRVQAAVLVYPVLEFDHGEDCLVDSIGRYLLADRKDDKDALAHITPKECISENTVPCFVIHNLTDPVVPSADSMRFALAMREHGLPVELHIFEGPGHGFSLADELSAVYVVEDIPQTAPWSALVHTWLKQRFHIELTEPPRRFW